MAGTADTLQSRAESRSGAPTGTESAATTAERDGNTAGSSGTLFYMIDWDILPVNVR